MLYYRSVALPSLPLDSYVLPIFLDIISYVFLKSLRKLQGNTCACVSFKKGCRLPACSQHWHNCILVNFTKYLRKPFITEQLRTTASGHISIFLTSGSLLTFFFHCFYFWLFCHIY